MKPYLMCDYICAHLNIYAIRKYRLGGGGVQECPGKMIRKAPIQQGIELSVWVVSFKSARFFVLYDLEMDGF